MNAEIPQFCRCTSSSVAHLRGCFEGWDKTSTTKGSTGPEEIARELTPEGEPVPMLPVFRERLANAIRAYGEEEFKRGKLAGVKGITSHIQSVTNAESEGFRRGVEEAARIADEHSGHGCECAYLIRQRGQKGER